MQLHSAPYSAPLVINQGEDETFMAHRTWLTCILVPEEVVLAITYGKREKFVLEERIYLGRRSRELSAFGFPLRIAARSPVR